MSRLAKNTGTPRNSNSKITNVIRVNGALATANGLIDIPEVTKNTGIKNPNAMPSSLCSRRSSPSGTACRSTKPAAKAPSTRSRSKTRASTPREISNKKIKRMVVCDVVSEPDRMITISRDEPRRNREAGSANKAATTTNTASSATDPAAPRAPQQDRHGDDRPDLSVRAVVEHGGAHRRVQEPVVPQDR